MEKSIFEIILDTGGLAIALAILFYYSVKSFAASAKERTDLKAELSDLQKQFRDFQKDTISKLIEIHEDSLKSINELSLRMSQCTQLKK
jgi:hypothetical protein